MRRRVPLPEVFQDVDDDEEDPDDPPPLQEAADARRPPPGYQTRNDLVENFFA